MVKMTITEALAELKTIGKRIDKKRLAIGPYLARQDMVRDPLIKEGGSEAYVAKELQAIRDLLNRVVKIRVAIQLTNASTMAIVRGRTRSIMEWLAWRKDVSKIEQTILSDLRAAINNARSQTKARGVNLVGPGESATKPEDVIITLSETQLNKEAEDLEVVLGDLDGVLSLMNATTFIEIAD